MANEIKKSIYYRSILNVLDVVEGLPNSIRKELKEREYQEALAVLEYNSQWVDFKPLDEETKGKLIKLAKKADKRQQLRKIIGKLLKKSEVATVEQILKMAGE